MHPFMTGEGVEQLHITTTHINAGVSNTADMCQLRIEDNFHSNGWGSRDEIGLLSRSSYLEGFNHHPRAQRPYDLHLASLCASFIYDSIMQVESK